MGLRLSLDVADPIAYLVERTPELRAARQRIFGRPGRAPSYDEKIRLGQLCDSALQRHHAARRGALEAMLAPFCTEMRSMPARAEREIANFAMLVPRDGVARFESAVADAAAHIADEYAVSLSGPWPPHNFARLELPGP
jgi:gas vesicle protein GvpL/GvpF